MLFPPLKFLFNEISFQELAKFSETFLWNHYNWIRCALGVKQHETSESQSVKPRNKAIFSRTFTKTCHISLLKISVLFYEFNVWQQRSYVYYSLPSYRCDIKLYRLHVNYSKVCLWGDEYLMNYIVIVVLFVLKQFQLHTTNVYKFKHVSALFYSMGTSCHSTSS